MVNGTTSSDRTSYFEVLPSNELALGLWLEADRMASLDISQDNFENQRKVVKEDTGKVPPTIVLDAPEETILASEEIFGPILPIVPYAQLDDAIAYVNQRDRPLALYCFSQDESRHQRVLDRTLSGGVRPHGDNTVAARGRGRLRRAQAVVLVPV